MSSTGLEVFDRTIQTSQMWLKSMMEELGWEDRHKAFQGLRVTLHTLRDRLPVEEAAHLGAQMPILIGGFYYENWKPANKPLKERHKEEFLNHIRDYFRMSDPNVDAEQIARAAFRVLSKQITQGEIEDIKHMMPDELRELWPESIPA